MYNTKSKLSELWVIMMCPCPFIHCNKCITLVGMLITGKAMHVWGRKYMGILCTLLSVLLWTWNYSKKIKSFKKTPKLNPTLTILYSFFRQVNVETEKLSGRIRTFISIPLPSKPMIFLFYHTEATLTVVCPWPLGSHHSNTCLQLLTRSPCASPPS